MRYQDFLRESNKAELISFINNYAEHISKAKKISDVKSAEEFYNEQNSTVETASEKA